MYDHSSKAAGSGPTSEELAAATIKWLKTFKPVALESKVEVLFREEQWEIIWTPPYFPKFQPIELVWGWANSEPAPCTSRSGPLKQPRGICGVAGTVARARQLRGSSRATCGVAGKHQREK